MIGHGGAFTLVGTGIQTDPIYGINYPSTNVIFTTSATNSSGNLRISMTTAATSVSTGAVQVSGGVGVVGAVVAGQLNTTGNVIAQIGIFNEVDLNGYLNSTGNILATGGVFNSLTVNGNESVTGFLNVTGNIIAATAEVGSVEAAGVIYANSTVAATSSSTGALITSGGLGVAQNAFFGANVTIQGNLFVNGNVSVFNTNNLSINDAMIYLADDNPADVLDIGFISSFTSGAGYQHTGFVRDASDGLWKLFAGVATEPTTTVDFTGATYSSLYVGNIQTVNSANIGSTLNVAGNILAKTATLGATTVNGATTLAGTTALQGTSTTQIVQPDGDNTRTLGAIGVRWSTVYGVTFSGTSTTANYADLAEKYQADAEYAPGTVLQFGGDQEVTLAEEGTRRVAGVVSTNPAHLMNDQLQGENTVALALTGRVPVKVKGRIQKGDMMVSAGDGYARASAMPQIGTVIGKSLEDFDGSDGIIEVVVGRL
jgi:hypothetical protein